MRALILRRTALIEVGAGGPVLIGPEDAPDVVRLQGFLIRNAYPYQVLDPVRDRDAADLVDKYAQASSDLPLAVYPKGTILKNPSEAELASALGMVRRDAQDVLSECSMQPVPQLPVIMAVDPELAADRSSTWRSVALQSD